jgi:hypothetical protein
MAYPSGRLSAPQIQGNHNAWLTQKTTQEGQQAPWDLGKPQETKELTQEEKRISQIHQEEARKKET